MEHFKVSERVARHREEEEKKMMWKRSERIQCEERDGKRRMGEKKVSEKKRGRLR